MISVKDLSVTYIGSSKPILDKAGIDIPSGKNIILYGKSGEGKSTLGKFLVNILPVQAQVEPGFSYTIGQQLIHQLNGKEKQKALSQQVGYIYQNPLLSLNPTQKIGWHFQRINKIHTLGLTTTDIIDQLNFLGFLDGAAIMERYPHQVSIGQAQRIAWLLAIIHKPLLLVADEPFSAQDQERKKQMVEHLMHHNRNDHMASLIITHDQNIGNLGFIHHIRIRSGKLASIPVPEPVEFSSTINIDLQTRHEIAACREMQVYYQSGFWKRGKKAIIKDCELQIYRTDSIAIMGESGAGKSTLARTLGGILDSYTGQLLVHDLDRKGTSDKLYFKNIQYIMQEPRLAMPTTKRIQIVLDDVIRSYFPEMSEVERVDKMTAVLELLELSRDFLDRLPAQCSGGEIQRITLAKALLVEPEMIIFDETFSALDWPTRNQIVNLLKKLQQKWKLTYLFISHNIEFLSQICNRFWIIDQQKVLEIDRNEMIARIS